MIWGCLQAHKRMNEFVKNQFNTDPDLFYIPNKHLQDNAATRKETADLHSSLEFAHTEIVHLEKRIDGINTKVH